MHYEENNVLVINILIQGKPLNAVDKRVYKWRLFKH